MMPHMVLWLRRWVDAVAGAVILVAALTGALREIEQPIDRWLATSHYPSSASAERD